jgi:hypothetical protein
MNRYETAEQHWRLVALLKVVRRFETHADAALWYREREPRLPGNCMVPGNPPLALSQTGGPGDPDLRKLISRVRDSDVVAEWDRRYAERMKGTPVFLACLPIAVNLQDPPLISRSDWLVWYGKIPGTQSYLRPPESLWRQLCLRAGIEPPAAQQTATADRPWGVEGREGPHWPKCSRRRRSCAAGTTGS